MIFGAFLIVILMLYVFVLGNPPEHVANICYFISAYCLTILCIRVAKGYKNTLKPYMINLLHSNKYTDRFFSDAAYKTIVSAYMSLAINLIYVLINLFAWLHYGSLWSVTLAVYYFLLTMMRFLLLKNTKVNSLGEDTRAEYIKYRNCAYVLLLMNFALAGIVMLVLHDNRGFYYAGYLIYMMAVYAFYNIISATIELIRYRNTGSPIISAAKAIRFASALISILSLEIAMLNSFDTGEDTAFRNMMISLTGLAISVIFITLSFHMIIYATRRLKEEL